MKLALSVVLTAVWLVAVIFGVGLAIHALDASGQKSEAAADLMGLADQLRSYEADTERDEVIAEIGLVLCPVGAWAIVMLVYGRPTRGARVLVLLTAGAVLALQLYDAASYWIVDGEIRTDGEISANGYGLWRLVAVVTVGMFVLGAFFWALRAEKSTVKTGQESQ
jgi:hypothetical protein